jgi:quercetin dioxygenase-like cupin family protein
MRNFFLVSIIAVFLPAHSLIGQERLSVDSSKYSIEKCVTTFSMERTEKTSAGYQFWYVGKELAGGKTLKLSVIAAHQASHPPHRHPEDEFFFVLEGTAEFYLEGAKTVVGPNTSLYCPSQMEHGIKNAGESELKYLVIKIYETQ